VKPFIVLIHFLLLINKYKWQTLALILKKFGTCPVYFHHNKQHQNIQNTKLMLEIGVLPVVVEVVTLLVVPVLPVVVEVVTLLVVLVVPVVPVVNNPTNQLL
jgi:hypothetical protein